MAADQAQLINWQSLSSDEQAFVASYIENGYSMVAAAEALELEQAVTKKYWNNKSVRAAIAEVQAELDNIDFLNERWVKAQIIRLMPKVLGEESVPMVDKEGSASLAKKFFPAEAINLIKMVNDMGNVKDASKLLNKGRIIAVWDDGTGDEEEVSSEGSGE